jgi:hypothetical protein
MIRVIILNYFFSWLKIDIYLTFGFLLIGHHLIFIVIIKIAIDKFMIFIITKVVSCRLVWFVEVPIIVIVGSIIIHIGRVVPKPSTQCCGTIHLKLLITKLKIKFSDGAKKDNGHGTCGWARRCLRRLKWSLCCIMTLSWQLRWGIIDHEILPCRVGEGWIESQPQNAVWTSISQ